jgi:SAM-dependent methyltransferase
MRAMVAEYHWPSQSFWRYFELNVLRGHEFARPILEIGSGDGGFSARLLGSVEEAIDINPKAVARSRSTGVYDRVRCMDARDLHEDRGAYGTVFANCVLEHIPDLDRVLAAARVALRPGGQLVATVPLAEMDNHLLVRARWYAELRRSQLVHVNLLSEAQWRQSLKAAGFLSVRIEPYLRASQIHFWDAVDSVGCIGVQRYRVSTATRLLGRRLVPKGLRRVARDRVADWLQRRAIRPSHGPPCAALIVAS